MRQQGHIRSRIRRGAFFVALASMLGAGAASAQDIGERLGRAWEGLQGEPQQRRDDDQRYRDGYREDDRRRARDGYDRGGRDQRRDLESTERRLDEDQRRLDAERRRVEAERRRVDRDPY
jgi:hypothetical protein